MADKVKISLNQEFFDDEIRTFEDDLHQTFNNSLKEFLNITQTSIATNPNNNTQNNNNNNNLDSSLQSSSHFKRSSQANAMAFMNPHV